MLGTARVATLARNRCITAPQYYDTPPKRQEAEICSSGARTPTPFIAMNPRKAIERSRALRATSDGGLVTSMPLTSAPKGFSWVMLMPSSARMATSFGTRVGTRGGAGQFAEVDRADILRRDVRESVTKRDTFIYSMSTAILIEGRSAT